MAVSSASGRTLLSLCHCSDRPAVRVHCFCINCKGKAVNYRTQRAHLDSATFCGAGRADKQASEPEFDIETEPTQGGKTFVIFFSNGRKTYSIICISVWPDIPQFKIALLFM